MKKSTLTILSLIISCCMVVNAQNRTTGNRNNVNRTEQTSNSNNNSSRQNNNKNNNTTTQKQPNNQNNAVNNNTTNKRGNNNTNVKNNNTSVKNNNNTSVKNNNTTIVNNNTTIINNNTTVVNNKNNSNNSRPRNAYPITTYNKPTRPSNWKASSNVASLGQIIGLTLGTIVKSSITSLVSQGISYTTYGSNIINVTNVTQYGYNWPEGTLFYQNGALQAGEFRYYSNSSATDRFYAISNQLTNQWGNPCNTTTGSSLSATWFTADNGFVTLTHEYSYPVYMTILTIGGE